MRYDPAQRLLHLATLLAGSRVGLSLDEMASQLGVNRRTVERMRDRLAETYPQLEALDGDDRIKRWRLPPNAGPPPSVRPEVVAAVESIAAQMAAGDADRADLLRQAGAILRGLMTPAALSRAEPDIEAMMQAEGIAMAPGPRPMVEPGVLEVLRQAILSMRKIKMKYRPDYSEAPLSRTVNPYGILRGRYSYLVANADRYNEMWLFRLDRISAPKMLEQNFQRIEFDLNTYAQRSFGVFQEEPIDVVLRFSAEAARDAEHWQFHPTQRTKLDEEGRLIVQFKAGGAREICWHLFTWGSEVKILEPTSLQHLMNEFCKNHSLKISNLKEKNDEVP